MWGNTYPDLVDALDASDGVMGLIHAEQRSLCAQTEVTSFMVWSVRNIDVATTVRNHSRQHHLTAIITNLRKKPLSYKIKKWLASEKQNRKQLTYYLQLIHSMLRFYRDPLLRPSNSGPNNNISKPSQTTHECQPQQMQPQLRLEQPQPSKENKQLSTEQQQKRSKTTINITQCNRANVKNNDN